MRIDLVHGGERPWFMRMAMRMARARLGVYPGPPLTMSYRPAFFDKRFVGFLLRGMHGSGGWTKGDVEMFASFVSSLNACRF